MKCSGWRYKSYFVHPRVLHSPYSVDVCLKASGLLSEKGRICAPSSRESESMFADEGELYQRSLSCQDEIKMATSRSIKLLDALLHSCLTIHLYKVCCGKFLDTSRRTGNEERRSLHHAVPVLQVSSFKFKFCSISVGLWAQAHAQSAQVQSGYFILSYHCAFLYALPNLIAPPRFMTSQGAIISYDTGC